jgi:hypothetical protein
MQNNSKCGENLERMHPMALWGLNSKKNDSFTIVLYNFHTIIRY